MDKSLEERKSELKEEIAVAKKILQKNISNTKPLEYVLPDFKFFKGLINKVVHKKLS